MGLAAALDWAAYRAARPGRRGDGGVLADRPPVRLLGHWADRPPYAPGLLGDVVRARAATLSYLARKTEDLTSDKTSDRPIRKRCCSAGRPRPTSRIYSRQQSPSARTSPDRHTHPERPQSLDFMGLRSVGVRDRGTSRTPP